MTRALSSVTGVVLLVALTVGLAAVVGLVGFGNVTATPTPRATFSISADATTDQIAITHDGGDTLSTDDLTVRVTVDGQALAHQPPIPFFAATGFASGPTGPFNPSADHAWSAGETAAFELASTNAPLLDPGSTVRVTISTDSAVVARLRTEAT